MARRSSLSLVLMLIINPIIILGFQNCSPINYSQAQDNYKIAPERQTAAYNPSEDKPVVNSCISFKKPCGQ